MSRTLGMFVMLGALFVVMGLTATLGAEGGPLLVDPARTGGPAGGTIALLVAFVAFWVAALTALVIAEPPDSHRFDDDEPYYRY